MKCISEERNVVLNLVLRNYCPKNRTIIIIFLDMFWQNWVSTELQANWEWTPYSVTLSFSNWMPMRPQFHSCLVMLKLKFPPNFLCDSFKSMPSVAASEFLYLKLKQPICSPDSVVGGYIHTYFDFVNKFKEKWTPKPLKMLRFAGP